MVCRQIGYTGGTYSQRGEYDQLERKGWLDIVNCMGDEARLVDCSHGGWGNNSCSRTFDVGVICTSAPLVPAILLDPRTLDVVEGRSATYEVSLATAPSANVTVTVSRTANTALTVNPTTLTFTASNFNDTQTVTVSASEDSDFVPDNVQLTHTASGGDYGTVTATLRVPGRFRWRPTRRYEARSRRTTSMPFRAARSRRPPRRASAGPP